MSTTSYPVQPANPTSNNWDGLIPVPFSLSCEDITTECLLWSVPTNCRFWTHVTRTVFAIRVLLSNVKRNEALPDNPF